FCADRLGAASGRVLTRDQPGRHAVIKCHPLRLVPLLLTPRIRNASMREAAKAISITAWVRAFIARQTAERRGRYSRRIPLWAAVFLISWSTQVARRYYTRRPPVASTFQAMEAQPG